MTDEFIEKSQPEPIAEAFERPDFEEASEQPVIEEVSFLPNNIGELLDEITCRSEHGDVRLLAYQVLGEANEPDNNRRFYIAEGGLVRAAFWASLDENGSIVTRQLHACEGNNAEAVAALLNHFDVTP